MANRRYTQFYQTLHNKPVQLDCNFVVDSTNGNGLGQRSLKGAGIQNVYLHTSATPAAGSPNPAVGYIYVAFQDNYNFYYFGSSGFVSQVSGTPLTSTTAGLAYVIVSLGSTTAAQWHAAGLPSGIVPAVGAAFIATATGAIGGSGAVEVPAAAGSGVANIEVVGDPNKTIVSSGANIQGLANGSYIILKCFDYAGAIVAPADGSVCGLSFVFSNSRLQVNGD